MANRKKTTSASEWQRGKGALLLAAWARDGLSDAEIAKNIGVKLEKLQEWRAKYPKIEDILQRTREMVDAEVENSLLMRAIGYTYEEKKECYRHGDLVEETVTTKHVIPDVNAQIFWLKNRKCNIWQDKTSTKLDIINPVIFKGEKRLKD